MVDQSTQAQLDERLEEAKANLLGVLNAGIDNVAITSAGPGSPKPESKKGGAADRISFGHPRSNRKNGTVILPVKVPTAGLVSTASAKKKKPPVVLPARKRVAAATTANLLIKPSKPHLALLARKHKLRVELSVTFNPDKGASESRLVPIVLKLAAPKQRRRQRQVRLKGVEPSRALAHTDLNRARLPVPPQPRDSPIYRVPPPSPPPARRTRTRPLR